MLIPQHLTAKVFRQFSKEIVLTKLGAVNMPGLTLDFKVIANIQPVRNLGLSFSQHLNR